MQMEAEVGVMRTQTKGCLEPPAAGDKERSSPQALGGGTGLRPLHLGLLASRTGRNHFHCCKSHLRYLVARPGDSHTRLFTALNCATALTGTLCWASCLQ